MTWNELIDRLQSIPEDRREEKAVFLDGGDMPWEIDEMELNNMMDEDGIAWPCNVGDDNMFTTYTLIP